MKKSEGHRIYQLAKVAAEATGAAAVTARAKKCQGQKVLLHGSRLQAA